MGRLMKRKERSADEKRKTEKEKGELERLTARLRAKQRGGRQGENRELCEERVKTKRGG